MNYYIMEEDSEYKGKYSKPKRESIKKIFNKREDIMECVVTDTEDFPDYIMNEKYIVSEKFKLFLEKYDPDIFLGNLVMINQKEEKLKVYYGFNPYNRNCISEKSIRNREGAIVDLVLEREKIGPFKIFKVSEKTQEFVIISEEPAEKLMREEFSGIKLKKIRW